MINDALEKAIADLKAIIIAEQLKACRDNVQAMMMKWLEVNHNE